MGINIAKLPSVKARHCKQGLILGHSFCRVSLVCA